MFQKVFQNRLGSDENLSCYRFTLHPFNKKKRKQWERKESVIANSVLSSNCPFYRITFDPINRKEEYVLAEKALPLSSELLRKLEQMRTLKETAKVSRSREEELEDEIMRLRKALEYSELRNEALHEVLKIGREQFGIDLLKKVGAKQ